MHELASRLVTNVKIPLMFDSTEWQKMEAGLQHAGGKCILNSTNYEDGVPRFESDRSRETLRRERRHRNDR